MIDMKFTADTYWVNRPEDFSISDEKVEIVTQPQTDLWQSTYYNFCHDNAPVLQTKTAEEYFTFTVKTSFSPARRFDQCGIAVYIDSQNWLKASVEYENESISRLGSVVTNNGYSDWATRDIPSSFGEVWYRLSRRGSDFLIECSFDGVNYAQMRICRLVNAGKEIPFGIYACSPENSSFRAIFTNFAVGECVWKEHK